MKKLDQLVLALLIFSGINWGLWGLFEFNLIGYIFCREWISRLFYIVLGVSAIYLGISWKAVGVRWSQRKK